jgi:hypothetical protein
LLRRLTPLALVPQSVILSNGLSRGQYHFSEDQKGKDPYFISYLATVTLILCASRHDCRARPVNIDTWRGFIQWRAGIRGGHVIGPSRENTVYEIY